MLGRGNKKAPAAVVGMQIDYDEFYQKFIKTTSRVNKLLLEFYAQKY